MSKATIEELKAMLVNAKIALIKERVPKNHCHYSYYDIGLDEPDCDEISCGDCRVNFFEEYKKKITLQIEAL